MTRITHLSNRAVGARWEKAAGRAIGPDGEWYADSFITYYGQDYNFKTTESARVHTRYFVYSWFIYGAPAAITHTSFI